MSQIVNKTKAEIKQAILDAAGKAVTSGAFQPEPLPDFKIEIPADRTHGDYSVNAAMVWARALHQAPVKIAQCICDNMDYGNGYIQRVEIAGPGFINIYLNDKFYADVVADIAKKGDNYGRSDYGSGKKVMVEFVSANPTGPMHIGNARGGALGDCLASVLDAAGYEVTREFYINDAGNQIDRFGASLEARYLQIFKGEENVEFPEDGYQGADIKERAQQFAEENGDAFVSKSSQERRKALVDFALPKNIEGLKRDLARYRIEYDVWFNESVLHNGGLLKKVIDIMKNNGLTYEKDGALWYKATEHGGEKDEVLIRANGNPTYFAADIAYHYNKFVIRGFDRVINVWGADHHGHVARLKGAMDAIGLDGSKLDIVLMQLVRLVRNGEQVRVSKRTGKSITLNSLLDEVPVDAARFFFNLREPNSHLEFDLDLAVEQSSQNPVYYVQYAHARICSILSALNKDGIEIADIEKVNLGLLNSPEERELIRYMAGFEEEILVSARTYDPARLTRYAIDLATLFHKFYNAQRVRCDDDNLMQARIYLCLGVRQVIRNTLKMLKIDSPDSM